MYSRHKEESFNMSRSDAKSINGGLAQEAKFLDTSTRKSGQQMNCLNLNKEQKMDFSIFYGQNSSFQGRPVQYTNNYQERSHQQAKSYQGYNQGSNSKQNASIARQNVRQNEQFQQQSVLRNNEAFVKPTQMINSTTSSNSLRLMGAPKPNQYSSTQTSTLSSVSASRNEKSGQTNSEYSSRVKRYGDRDAEKMCIFTGTVERVIKWGKIFQNHFCYFEVIAAVVSLADGKVQFEKIMLLRDRKKPIMQVTYYSNATHINIEDFHLGQMLRAVGRIIGPNIMSAITIRAATQEEIETLPRMCYVSDHAISTLCVTARCPVISSANVFRVCEVHILTTYPKKYR